MPHKGGYRAQFEDDYDVDDEDYGYDYADDYEDEVPQSSRVRQGANQEVSAVVWRCPICTYDNEDSYTACDICGVLRNPLVKPNGRSGSAGDPFKFDVPSPDDLVSNGLKGLKLKSKGNVSSERKRTAPMETKLPPKELDGHDSLMIRRTKPLDAANSGSLNSSFSGPGKATTDAAKSTSVSQNNLTKNRVSKKLEVTSNQLNLAVVGHVDSGKSTLSGRLLHLLGRISQKEMHKYKEEAKQHGKGSFAYAWAMDESPEERERGITMTVGVAFFKSKKYDVVLLDSPGHRDLVPNMISGATQADAAILVIDGSMGSFEGGMDATRGQTREHAQLIRSFGVDQIIVVVNKMDVVEYSEERYDAIKQKLGTFLSSCGYKDSSIIYLPASAMENQNLTEKPSDVRLSWFDGPSLLEAVDSIQLPARDNSKPLLMPVCDVIRLESQNQVSACGKLETGFISAGSKVLVMPSRERAKVHSLWRDSHVCDAARAGDNVTVILQGIEENLVAAGGVICHPDFPVKVASCLELKILVLEISTPILIGSQMEFHIHHAKTAARVSKILSLLDRKTGKVIKKSPRCLLSKQNAVIEVILDEAMCVEEYSKCRALGRVFLRVSGRTIAMGIVTQATETEWYS